MLLVKRRRGERSSERGDGGSDTCRGMGRPDLALLLFTGVVCFVVGGALAWGLNPLLGFAIGGFGTVLLVVGAVLFRNAMVGRFLQDGQEEP